MTLSRESKAVLRADLNHPVGSVCVVGLGFQVGGFLG